MLAQTRVKEKALYNNMAPIPAIEYIIFLYVTVKARIVVNLRFYL